MEGRSTIRLRIGGMDCGSCALTIEQAVRRLPGVAKARLDFTTEMLEAEGEVSAELIARRVRDLGYRVLGSERTPRVARDTSGFAGFVSFLWAHAHTRLALLVSAALAVYAVCAGLAPGTFRPFVPAALALGVILVGAPLFVRGVRSLIVARRITIELLMAIAAGGALAIGASGEALAVVLLYTLGEALEARSAVASRRALDALLSLQPADAEVVTPRTHDCCGSDEHAHPSRKPIAQIRVGERLLVRPGERIPLDARIVRGRSAIDQSAVTGESLPVERGPGDEVLGGTINGGGVLMLEVLREAPHSTVARIARLVEQALARRSPAERFIDRFARWYTPAVVVLAPLSVAVAVWGFGQPFHAAGADPGWLYRGLALLIIACPCALVISIPVTVVSALTRLARLGVLVRGGAQLDRLADVAVVAFDKTGTLTGGAPRVTQVETQDCGHTAEPTDCSGCEELVAVAAALESGSEHPLGRAVIEHAHARGLKHSSLALAENVQALAGRGIIGDVGGARVRIGRHELFEHAEDCREAVCASAERAQRAGNTVLLVERDSQMLGYIGVRDQARSGSAAAVAALRALEPRPMVAMLTGDGDGAAAAVARELGGVDIVQARLLPAGKQDAVRALQRHGTVAMVGDGINDAPALAQADIGIAMGGVGTAQAIETADVVLMSDDPGAVAVSIRLARRTRRLLRQNIAASLALKVLVLGLAVPGLATLWGAVLADVGATLLVTLNGMRLLRAR